MFDWSGIWLYLAEDCQLVADVSARRLRSADSERPVSRAARPTSSATDASQLSVHGVELAANQSKTVSQSETIQAFVKDIPV